MENFKSHFLLRVVKHLHSGKTKNEITKLKSARFYCVQKFKSYSYELYSVTFGQIAVKRKKDVEDAMNYHGKLITKTLLFRKVYYFKNLFMRFT